MMYEIRRTSPHDPSPYRADRWVIHHAGRRDAIAAYTLTRWGAIRTAKRWMRQELKASKSEPIA